MADVFACHTHVGRQRVSGSNQSRIAPTQSPCPAVGVPLGLVRQMVVFTGHLYPCRTPPPCGMVWCGASPEPVQTHTQAAHLRQGDKNASLRHTVPAEGQLVLRPINEYSLPN